jgi:hypothetical protein
VIKSLSFSKRSVGFQLVFQGCLDIHKAGVSSHEPEAGHQDEEQLAGKNATGVVTR